MRASTFLLVIRVVRKKQTLLIGIQNRAGDDNLLVLRIPTTPVGEGGWRRGRSLFWSVLGVAQCPLLSGHCKGKERKRPGGPAPTAKASHLGAEGVPLAQGTAQFCKL